MKSLIVNEDSTLEIREIPIPRYSSKQALVKNISCGICGTDATIIAKKFKGITDKDYPLMLGHESIGEVVEIGSEVTTFKIGDKVFIPYNDPDPEHLGDLGAGWGGFSEYAVVNDPACYAPGEAPGCAYGQTVLPDDIDPVDAAMAITFREVLSNIKYFGIKENDSVVVFGSGPVALTFMKFMSLLGIKEIVAIVRNQPKYDAAKEHGATWILNSTECDVNEEIRKKYPDGVDYVLDAVGSEDVINQAFGLIKDRGEILCYGVPKGEQLHLDFSKASYNWKINFQQMPDKAEEGANQEQVLNWVRTGKIKFSDFISDYYEFDDVLQAFEDFKNKKILKKAIVKF